MLFFLLNLGYSILSKDDMNIILIEQEQKSSTNIFTANVSYQTRNQNSQRKFEGRNQFKPDEENQLGQLYTDQKINEGSDCTADYRCNSTPFVYFEILNEVEKETDAPVRTKVSNKTIFTNYEHITDATIPATFEISYEVAEKNK